MKQAPVALVLAALLGGCSYYNGMYNTEQLAGRARKAEREGRPFDAQSFWSQVAVRAESAVVRHPRAAWADRARLLQGTALARVNACDRALHPLEELMLGSRRPAIAEEAALLVGECRLKESDAEGATEAFGRLLQSPDRERRSLALYYHGRALRLAGQPELALAELRQSGHPGALGERAAALAALGRVEEAVTAADSLAQAGDTLAPWAELVAGVAAADPEAATGIVDRLRGRPGVPAALQARLLLADGMRWLRADSARGDRRLREADSTGRRTPVQAEIRYQLARLALARARTLEDLRVVQDRLEEFSDEAGTYGAAGTQLGLTARRVVQMADSIGPDTPNGDLRAFLAGEIARDSLGADQFAAAQFRQVATLWQDSPFAPKALLALIDTQGADADSLREVLRTRYGASPYLAIVEGRETPAFTALEDSLQRFSASYRPESRQPRPRPTARPPGQRPQPGAPRQPGVN